MSHLSNLFFPNFDIYMWDTIELSWFSITSDINSSSKGSSIYSRDDEMFWLIDLFLVSVGFISKPLLSVVVDVGGCLDESNFGTGMAFLERGDWFSTNGPSNFYCNCVCLPFGSLSSGRLLSVFMKFGLFAFFLNFISSSSKWRGSSSLLRAFF